MKEFELKYGCNPNQKPSKIYMADGSELPIEILCGRPGYINFLDAFNSWYARRNFIQARFAHIGCSRHQDERKAQEGLLC